MKQITIVVPYAQAGLLTATWAADERNIDFRKDSLRAARCTTAFAATELKSYLERQFTEAEITFSEQRNTDGFNIVLALIDPAGTSDCFTMRPDSSGVIISGQGRTGLLFGAYELLRLQGWAWYAPGKKGEIVPQPRETLVFPAEEKEYRPDFSLGRGFVCEGVFKESAELWLWMARNKLNLATARPASIALCRKLGLKTRVGGHIFEVLLNPDRRLPSGKSLWEEHPDWYGLPADGLRIREKALTTQFCVSQPGLLDFLGRELIEALNCEYRDADEVDIWGFDTWGSTCTCPACDNLGNSTDQYLYFLSSLRSSVDKAREAGELDHEVILVGCCYEGTVTLQGPAKPFPPNLIRAGDYVTFFPILRCYAHEMSETACDVNQGYEKALKSWFAQTPHMPVMIGEYYNVSKFEDLPVLFTSRMPKDLQHYRMLGASGMTYMHVPMVNWSVRTITQVLYAALSWDLSLDLENMTREYFRNWYGPYAEEMKPVYAKVEQAWRMCTDWRAQGKKSVIAEFHHWDGRKPAGPLAMQNHFRTSQEAARSGDRSVALMRQALKHLLAIREREKIRTAQGSEYSIDYAVDTALAERKIREECYEVRLGEDCRSVHYGLDTLMIMTGLVKYYDAALAGQTDQAQDIWQKIEKVADRLDSYYFPIGYEQPGPGLVSKDALTRTQLRNLIRHIRKSRLE